MFDFSSAVSCVCSAVLDVAAAVTAFSVAAAVVVNYNPKMRISLITNLHLMKIHHDTYNRTPTTSTTAAAISSSTPINSVKGMMGQTL